MSTDAAPPHLVDRLLRAIGRVEPRIRAVTELSRLTGGASQETWKLRVAGVERLDEVLILRRVPNDVMIVDQIGPEAEAAAIRRATAADVPVPHIRLELTPADELGRGFISDFVAGETLPQKIQRDPAFAPARSRFARQCGEILARIHAVPTDGLDLLPTLSAASQVDNLRRVYAGRNRPNPVWELGFAWLEARIDRIAQRRVLVHGDFRMGNLMIAPDGIAAVLDWELAHIGDPVEDLGYLTVNSWRFGAIDLPVGGVGVLDDLLDAYHAAGGVAVTRDEVHFWRALGTMKWGILSGELARAIGFSAVTLERAVIGRRSTESELDLLDIIEGIEP
ncbi:phosphotransferase family protein [Novosphingobium sp. 9U]|uniref:phosphotransferase family protein n=1 Tax=Novosphingobium sp. 9U TaxID=2653158 RepID=UPI0012F45C1C|nr:phosphotransferase family protein [Novosphingobium sp. 9U]VWX50286.1 Aminoglycoside phosphotransferase (APT) family kinase protein [Novosphingobium sp. 9U]